MNGELLSTRKEYEDEGPKNQQNLLVRRSLNLGRTSGQVVWNERSPINARVCGRKMFVPFLSRVGQVFRILVPKSESGKIKV